MDVEEELRRIYRDPTDPGSLGRIDRLLRRAKQLKVPGVNCLVVEQFLKREQASQKAVCPKPHIRGRN